MPCSGCVFGMSIYIKGNNLMSDILEASTLFYFRGNMHTRCRRALPKSKSCSRKLPRRKCGRLWDKNTHYPLGTSAAG
ncbi:hypothetical protein HBH56_003490 [Parastagonospora nodorum]|nr:hypothetical protein HBH56_003490 [Parastagonospora nodorum]KAH3938249.1 hypothetical protein HBH54_003480 [Parastagonospora nodorum]KAH3975061.1 hypothetical protein HBH51_086250 [Parastagonospora nodorum]KAH3978446.1 hypothetical protein HBH52_106560 [Parastagonospora nodorum]KAH4001553.1 hypothetical protein HBI10_088240 [Parastagonospora nodorum]